MAVQRVTLIHPDSGRTKSVLPGPAVEKYERTGWVVDEPEQTEDEIAEDGDESTTEE